MSDDEDEDILRYDLMVERALRAVVRDSLEVAAEEGLPGDHHFYITFRTDFPGVEISETLRTRYNDEMTIVIQHQFWDLAVAEDYFAITLSFSGRPERLVVPYESVTAFADPAAQVGLRFEPQEEGEGEEAEDGAEAEGEAAEAEGGEVGSDLPEGGGGEVVSLESFRKRND